MKCAILVSKIMFGVVLFLLTNQAFSQYAESPLKGRKWYSFAGGLNSADFISWQGMASFSMRGEAVLTQTRLAFTQELVNPKNDDITFRRNKMAEFALMWGDGWGNKKWYATGSIGFGFNVRFFGRRTDYEDEYLTVITAGVPIQLEFGMKLGKSSGINLTGVGNWNFRQPYLGCNVGYFILIK
jgi:hypothetical protein